MSRLFRLRFRKPAGSTVADTALSGFITFNGLARDYYQLDPSNVGPSNTSGYWGGIGGSIRSTSYSTVADSSQVLGAYVRPWIGATDSSNYPEGDRFTTDASRSGAGGDRGFRTVLGEGTNQGGGGIKINFDSTGGVTAHPEIWVKLWVRFPAGLQPATSSGGALDRWHYIKEFDFNDGLGTPDGGRVTWGASQGQSGSGNFGFTTYENQVSYPANISTLTWASMMGQSTGTPVTGDGIWHSYQIHMKKPSSALNDGVAEFWFDGVQYINMSTIATYCTSTAFQGWQFMGVAVNQNWVRAETTDWFWDIDDIMWSTTGFITQDAP